MPSLQPRTIVVGVSDLRRAAVERVLGLRARFGSAANPAGPPPAVPREPDEPLSTYWRARVEQHLDDSWAGVPLLKMPEDLRTYQHLLWESRADTVIEVGAKWGGSLLWFRDQLRTFVGYGRLEGAPSVVGLDLITSPAETVLDRADPGWREQITLLQGDVTEPETVKAVHAAVRPGARCLVVEDSAHTTEVTTAALNALAPLVHPGGFFVVEDAIVDEPLVYPEGPPLITQTGTQTGGVAAAIDAWLDSPSGREFSARPDLELYGITGHPGGFLQRREPDA